VAAATATGIRAFRITSTPVELFGFVTVVTGSRHGLVVLPGGGSGCGHEGSRPT
jgi:hypothetical protein